MFVLDLYMCHHHQETCQPLKMLTTGTQLCNSYNSKIVSNFFSYNSLVQAEYWHDPLNVDEYRKKSVFLADINQEVVGDTLFCILPELYASFRT